MGELRQYHLDFDGPLFRRQRVLLLGIAESVRRSGATNRGPATKTCWRDCYR